MTIKSPLYLTSLGVNLANDLREYRKEITILRDRIGIKHGTSSYLYIVMCNVKYNLDKAIRIVSDQSFGRPLGKTRSY